MIYQSSYLHVSDLTTVQVREYVVVTAGVVVRCDLQ